MKLSSLMPRFWRIALFLAAIVGCRVPRTAPSHHFQWPLPDLEVATTPGIAREIRITQDFGLGGPGPTIRILVDSTRVRGEAYVTHYLSHPDDSSGMKFSKETEARYRSEYGCKSFVLTKDEAICRLPFRIQPDWVRLLTRLDSLRSSAPSPLPRDPNLVCTDSPGWGVVERTFTELRRDETRFCGPGTAARANYENAMWELLRSIDQDARFK
jgi:hypothetical protein